MADVDADPTNDPERRTRARPSLSSSSASTKTVTTSYQASPARAAPAAGHALEKPPRRKARTRRSRPVRMLKNMCRSLPLLNPGCGARPWPMLPPGASASAANNGAPPSSSSDSLLSQLIGSSSFGSAASSSSRHRVTGTLFGYRDGRVSLSLQQNARCQPTLVVELALPTHALLRELGAHAGARIVLEIEKRSDPQSGDGAGSGSPADGGGNEPIAAVVGESNGNHALTRRGGGGDDEGWVLEELMWTMFCNGKRVGYAVRREPTEEDIAVLETLWAVTMGGGVLPGLRSDGDGADGEMAYMRGSFEHTVGSRDSESLYMVGPPGGDCPELAIFFVRL